MASGRVSSNGFLGRAAQKAIVENNENSSIPKFIPVAELLSRFSNAPLQKSTLGYKENRNTSNFLVDKNIPNGSSYTSLRQRKLKEKSTEPYYLGERPPQGSPPSTLNDQKKSFSKSFLERSSQDLVNTNIKFVPNFKDQKFKGNFEDNIEANRSSNSVILSNFLNSSKNIPAGPGAISYENIHSTTDSNIQGSKPSTFLGSPQEKTRQFYIEELENSYNRSQMGSSCYKKALDKNNPTGGAKEKGLNNTKGYLNVSSILNRSLAGEMLDTRDFSYLKNSGDWSRNGSAGQGREYTDKAIREELHKVKLKCASQRLDISNLENNLDKLRRRNEELVEAIKKMENEKLSDHKYILELDHKYGIMEKKLKESQRNRDEEKFNQLNEKIKDLESENARMKASIKEYLFDNEMKKQITKHGLQAYDLHRGETSKEPNSASFQAHGNSFRTINPPSRNFFSTPVPETRMPENEHIKERSSSASTRNNQGPFTFKMEYRDMANDEDASFVNTSMKIEETKQRNTTKENMTEFSRIYTSFDYQTKTSERQEEEPNRISSQIHSEDLYKQAALNQKYLEKFSNLNAPSNREASFHDSKRAYLASNNSKTEMSLASNETRKSGGQKQDLTEEKSMEILEGLKKKLEEDLARNNDLLLKKINV